MATSKKDPVLVVMQLSGGNDYLNCVVPYTNSLYYDNRPVVKVDEEKVHKLDDEIAFHPSMGEMADLYRRGRRGHTPRRGIPQLPQVSFPLHGHLAHL